MSTTREPKYSISQHHTPEKPALEQPQTKTTVKTHAELDTDAEATAATELKVQRHAVFRYLSRVDATDPYPKSRIRQLFERARPVPFGPDGTRWDEETGLVFVRTNGGAVQTCYCRTRSGVGLG